MAHRKKILGLVGGMGPLASAAFLKTIYEHNLGQREQDAPTVLLYSDPTFPDRTDALLRGDYDLLLESLSGSLQFLRKSGSSKIIICCITSHYLLPQLSDVNREPVVSLLDVIFNKIMQKRQEHLLVCTNGTRRLKLFQQHPSWAAARKYIVLPDEPDQQAIHEMIYLLKMNGQINEAAVFLKGLLSKYRTPNFIAGCTEIHLLSKYFISFQGDLIASRCLDPLSIISEELIKNWYESGALQ